MLNSRRLALLLSIVVTAWAATGLAQDAVDPALGEGWANELDWRCIGPANMGGRMVGLAVNPQDPSMYWVATASGGLLKTVNRGVTFEHQFDREATVSLGAVAVSASNPDVVWVGTGENNPRNSVSYGNGVYRSVDGGETWLHRGLDATFQIGCLAIHPTDENTVYVGALGRLYGPNEERGLYKTTDGGDTWNRVLFVDEHTGVIDMVMHPTDPETMLVATYERARDGFDGNDPAKKIAPGSGLHRTRDGGQTWERLTQGLPTVPLGRIGLDYYRKNPEVVFMILESEKIGSEPDTAPFAGFAGEDSETGARLTRITADGPADQAGLKEEDIVLRVGGKTVLSYAGLLDRVREFSAGDNVSVEVARQGESLEFELALTRRPEGEGENSRSPFSANLGGQRQNIQTQQGPDGHEYGGVYRSDDGGTSWTRINSLNPRPMYFSQIRVDPSDDQFLYVLGVSAYQSKDGGKTFTSDASRGVHSDQHALWIDPEDGRHMILGTDGGLYVTYDRTENWDHLSHMALGQFYHCAVGPRRDYMVYGGLQDNGTWGGPHRGRDGEILNQDWLSIGGGDGFVVAVDRDDPDLVYYESQNGGMGRRNLRTGESARIRPSAPRGTRYRFNWKTPFLLSAHNTKIYYCAGNQVFRSLDRGEDLRAISPDITRTEQGSATALAESPLNPDLLYVGTDDGALWVTTDGGHQWTDLFPVVDPNLAKAAAAGEPIAESGADVDPKAVAAEGATAGDGSAARAPAAAGGPNAEEPLAAAEGAATTDGEGGADDAASAGEASQEAGATDGGSTRQDEGEADDGNAREDEADAADNEVSGIWRGQIEAEGMPPGSGEFEIRLRMTALDKIRGSTHSENGDSDILDGTYDPNTRRLVFRTESDSGEARFEAVLTGSRMSGDLVLFGGDFTLPFTARREGPWKSDEAPAEPTAPEADSARRTGDRTRRGEAGRRDSGGEESGPAGAALQSLLEGPRWVASIEASRFEEGRAYVVLDGHRSDDDRPYVFVTEDAGKSWRSLNANLPEFGSTRVLREDRENQDVLYLGTEFGAWVSLNRGGSWMRLHGDTLPTVAVHEFAQHDTSGEIVAATHGRSLWILDVTPLRQMTAEALAAKAHLYRPNDVVVWRRTPGRGSSGARRFVGENPPFGAPLYYSLAEPARQATLRVLNADGELYHEEEVDTAPGLHQVVWNLRRDTNEGGRGRRFARAPDTGEYKVELRVDGETYSQRLRIVEDPGIGR